MRDGSDGRRLETQRRLAVLSLKRCPLCGAVNAVANEECFVCRWHGEFERDPDSVDEGLGELLVRCPELMDAMLEPAEPKGLIARAKGFFRRFFRKQKPAYEPLLDL